MTDNFTKLSNDEPSFDDGDTQDDNITQKFSTITLKPKGEFPVCHFQRPTDGLTVGPVIVNSYAFRLFIKNNWRMVTVQS